MDHFPTVGHLKCTVKAVYVSGSSKIQTLSFDSSSIKTEIYSDGNTQVIKFAFFIYKCVGIKLTSAYITQWVLATPTLIGT